ncbi:unnamed protein product [Amaranthus hypochondriacus]
MEKEKLNQTLTEHMSNIHETLQIMDLTPSSSLQKVSWEEVLKIGDQLSKNATSAGMLFSEEKITAKELEENMKAYFNLLQGFVLLGYGSTVGAGPTLSSNIHASLKQVIDSSFSFWRESVASYGHHAKENKRTIPQLAGIVWDACSALKKTPTTNVIAIGRGITRVAVSMKDVLRELKELEPCSSDPTNEISIPAAESTPSDVDADEYDDLGKDLSPKEMKVAQLAITIVSEAVIVVKELIRSISGLVKKENLTEEQGVESLEKLLKLCRSVGIQVDELGACLYPPQELSAIAKSCQEISNLTDEVEKELHCLNSSVEAFVEGCNSLKKVLEAMKLEVCSSPLDDGEVAQNSGESHVVEQMQNLAV